jgi:leucyl aminopeptidase (aminopeptidase T)
VELRFDAGRLIDVGGPEGWRLADALERSGDEGMWNLAEVSIGLNPHSRPGGSPLELEGIVGGAHVAVGNNVAYGGSVDARSHIDCVLLAATLSLDGDPLDPTA